MSEINVTLNFTVNPATPPPPALSFTVVSPAPTMTVGVALPAGTAVANVTGGVPPYSAVADPNSAPLPPGVTLGINSTTGEIDAAGTPTTAGTFSGVILDVSDSALGSGTQTTRLKF